MILSFKDTLTQAVAEGRAPKGFPTGLVRGAQRKLAMLNAARRLDDLKSPPGNNLRALFADRKGQHALRINNQLRLSFAGPRAEPRMSRSPATTKRASSSKPCRAEILSVGLKGKVDYEPETNTYNRLSCCSRQIRCGARAERGCPSRPYPCQRTRRAVVPYDGARLFNILHGGWSHEGPDSRFSGAPRGSTVFLTIDRPTGCRRVQRGSQINRRASAGRTAQEGHQRRCQRDRRVVGGRYLAPRS